MEPISFFLPPECYTFENVDGDQLASQHLDAVNDSSSSCHFYVHYTIGSLESIPYLGKLFSYLEVLIAKVALYFISCCSSPSPEETFENELKKLPDNIRETISEAFSKAKDVYNYGYVHLTLGDYDQYQFDSVMDLINSPHLPQIQNLHIATSIEQFRWCLNQIKRLPNRIETLTVFPGDIDEDGMNALAYQLKNEIAPPIDELQLFLHWRDQRFTNAFIKLLKAFPEEMSLNLSATGITPFATRALAKFMEHRVVNAPEKLSLSLQNLAKDALQQIPTKIPMKSFKVIYRVNTLDQILLLSRFNNITSLTMECLLHHFDNFQIINYLHKPEHLILDFSNTPSVTASMFEGINLENLHMLTLSSLTDEEKRSLKDQFPGLVIYTQAT